jgi:hypothetical protein
MEKIYRKQLGDYSIGKWSNQNYCLKFLQENTRQMLCVTRFGDNFLDMTPKAQATREK